jgi:hypothetical protein
MPVDDDAGIGKLLACHTRAIVGIAQDMHDADSTVTNRYLALYRQFQYHLI